MQEFGGFNIRFISHVDMGMAIISIKKSIDGFIEDYERIVIDESKKKISIDADTPILFGDFGILLEKICKAIVSDQPNVSFDGLAQYSNLSVDFYAYHKVKYRQRTKELIIEKISGENLDGYCPECGERLFKPEECVPQNIYYCGKCCKEFEVDVNYSKSRWLLDDDFILQNIKPDL